MATLALKEAVVEAREMSEIEKLLGIVSHPNVAYLLFLLGLLGLYFELSSPGAILPGIVGGISLLLALYAFSVLPVNLAGLALILFAIAALRGGGQGRQPRPARRRRRRRPRGAARPALSRAAATRQGYRVDLSIILPGARRDARGRGLADLEHDAAARACR